MGATTVDGRAPNVRTLGPPLREIRVSVGAEGRRDQLGSGSHADDIRVAANERLTALAGAVLLLLILVELVTSASLGTLISAHIFVGVLLAGPLVIKLASTGYRFVRYYSGSVPFVRKGPPLLTLRVLAIPLVATTIVLVGSGFGLLASGPAQPGPLLGLHNVSALIWLPMIAIHALAYLRRIPQIVAADWPWRPSNPLGGRRFRLGVNLVALLAAAAAAIVVLPTDGPWVSWAQTVRQAPAPLIVGTVVAVVAVLAVRPFRWD